MKLKEEKHIKDLSPKDIIDTTGLDLTPEETRIFSDTVLLAQQYYKYSEDYIKGKTELTNKDNKRWYKRFLFDVLQRPQLVELIDSKYLEDVEKLIKEMATLDLSFSADCLEMEDLYGHTIQDIVAHPLKSFYDLKYFIGECTKPKYQHISEKIDAVDKKATLKIHFT